MPEPPADLSEEEESTIRAFLLGRLAESDREEVEVRLLGDPAFSELTSAIEAELIDDYAAGLLSRDDRRRFEGHFLVTDDRRRRLRFSQTLALAGVGVMDSPVARRKAAERSSFRPAWWDWSMTVAATVAAAALGSTFWMFDSVTDLREQLRQAEDQVADLLLEREQLAERHRLELERAARVAPPPAARPSGERLAVAALLTPGTLRAPGSPLPAVQVDSGTLIVELRLDVSEAALPNYDASVHDASGNEICRFVGVRSEATAVQVLVTVQVPSLRVPPGDYSIRLWARNGAAPEEVERYYFRVRGR